MYYRFEVLTRKKKNYAGPLKGIDFEAVGIDMETYEELFSFLNINLPVPFGMNMGKFWFNEKGYKTFKPYMEKIISTVAESKKRYIRKARIIRVDAFDENTIRYEDYYQVSVINDVPYVVEEYLIGE